MQARGKRTNPIVGVCGLCREFVRQRDEVEVEGVLLAESAQRALCSSGRTPKAGGRPDPSGAGGPRIVYRSEWQGWADWLGTRNEQRGVKRDWRPFAQARSFVRTLGLGSQAEWDAYVRGRLPGETLPGDIPRLAGPTRVSG